jgi:hypothetical protein
VFILLFLYSSTETAKFAYCKALALAKKSADHRAEVVGNRITFRIFREFLVPCLAERKGCSKLQVLLAIAETNILSEEVTTEQFNAFNDKQLRAMYQDINNDDDVKSFLFHVQKEQEKRQGSTVYMTALEKERAQQRKKSIIKLRNSIRLEQSESPKKIRTTRAALQGSPYSSPVQVQRKVSGGGLGGGVTPGRKRSGPGPGVKGEEIRHPSRT